MPAVKQALIIAAGNGSRLQPASGEIPKPLTPVCGVPLLKRLLHRVRKAGIESAVIVIGYQGQALKEAITEDADIDIPIEWVENPDWKKANGVSVLKAKPYLKDDFVLLMADHLFQTRTLASLLRRRPSPGEVILAVDRKIDRIYDIDDATKVKLNTTRILKIGKKIKDYNAADTGMFLCSQGIFAALEQAIDRGDCSLSDGMSWLIAQKKLRFFDVKDGWWLDVDTPIALRHAERQIFEGLRKREDGFLRQKLYRPLSLKLTKFLLKTSFSFQALDVAVLAVGIVAGFAISMGTYFSVLFGALLLQLFSVMSCSQEELTKLKLKPRRKIQDLSTKIVYMTALGGITLGYFRHTPETYIILIGFMMIFDVFLSLSFRSEEKASEPRLDTVQTPASHDLSKNILQGLQSFGRQSLRLELVAFMTLAGALLGKISWIFWIAFLTTHLSVLAIVYAESRRDLESKAKLAR